VKIKYKDSILQSVTYKLQCYWQCFVLFTCTQYICPIFALYGAECKCCFLCASSVQLEKTHFKKGQVKFQPAECVTVTTTDTLVGVLRYKLSRQENSTIFYMVLLTVRVSKFYSRKQMYSRCSVPGSHKIIANAIHCRKSLRYILYS
jgi:hypothetical protein